MKKLTVGIVAAISAGIVAGCGGGGSNSATVAVSGAVADGYLAGARVFLDKDGDYQRDADEPWTDTDANGTYTLKMQAECVGRYPIVAMAIKGVTTDKDTNLPVQNSYLLSMPGESVNGMSNSNFISPMSTQVRELMETGLTRQQAMDQLRTQLGLPDGVDMMADYLANPSHVGHQAMHDAAKNMAELMGSQMEQVFGPGEGGNVDVNRYRGMMGGIFSGISSISGEGSDAQEAMSNLRETMMSELQNIRSGEPFMNMSSSFRGGMMGRGR